MFFLAKLKGGRARLPNRKGHANRVMSFDPPAVSVLDVAATRNRGK